MQTAIFLQELNYFMHTKVQISSVQQINEFQWDEVLDADETTVAHFVVNILPQEEVWFIVACH